MMKQQHLKKHWIMAGIMLSFCWGIRGQTLTNDATLSLESGVNLSWEGEFVNEGSGTIELNGSISLNGNLTNNSNNPLTTGTGFVIFNGSGSNQVGGSSASRFYGITHDKVGSTSLNRNIQVDGPIYMLKGTINLNGQIMDLGSTGSIADESNDSRIMGSPGKITLIRTLNDVDEANLAGIGLGIDTDANLGATVIERSHGVLNLGSGTSIRRAIYLNPTNNSNLNAALRFYYFPAELNGQNPNSLDIFRKPGGSPWTVNTASVTGNSYVEGNGYDSFGLFTLSSDGVTALDDPRPALSVNYFPNPLTQGQPLQIEGLRPGDYQFLLYDLAGKQVWSMQKQVFAAGSKEFIGLPILASGLYTFRILSDQYAPSTGKLHIHSS